MQQSLEEGGMQHLMVYGDGELAPNQTSIYFYNAACNLMQQSPMGTERR